MSWVSILRDVYDCFCSERNELSIPAVSRYAVDCTVVTHLIEAHGTLIAAAVVTTVPWSANPVTFLPFLLRGRDSSDLANDLVTWDDRETIAEAAKLDNRVGVADAAG